MGPQSPNPPPLPGGGAYVLRHTQVFQVFGANPVPCNVDNKTMQFSQKTYFFGSNTADKNENTMGSPKN